MKKLIIIFAIITVVLLIIISVSLIENNKNLAKIQKNNKEYEEYIKKTVYGTEVITLINKATDENIKNEIQQDEKGYFIENDTNSIKIDINLLYDEKLITYPMELLTKVRNRTICSKL